MVCAPAEKTALGKGPVDAPLFSKIFDSFL